MSKKKTAPEGKNLKHQKGRLPSEKLQVDLVLERKAKNREHDVQTDYLTPLSRVPLSEDRFATKPVKELSKHDQRDLKKKKGT